MTLDLNAFGWDDGWQASFEPHAADGLIPARIAVQHRGGYVVFTERGEQRAEAARHFVRDRELPTVGDWVALREGAGRERGVVEAVLPRRTKFSRLAAGPSEGVREQVVAANVDTVFLVAALGRDFNVRRLERYLVTAWESGARPVILLTKVDVHRDDVPQAVADVGTVAFGVPVHAVSNVTGEGHEQLEQYLVLGKTVALLGSSGVGKSTLVNKLAGREVLATRAVREADEKGRHTTTHRELVPLPGGALLLDTPGMRELQLWDAGEGIEEAFADIAELVVQCRFNDCSHETEPGCAVRAALEDGRLAPERWDSYRKLERELEALAARGDKALASERRREWRRIHREMRREHKPR